MTGGRGRRLTCSSTVFPHTESHGGDEDDDGDDGEEHDHRDVFCGKTRKKITEKPGILGLMGPERRSHMPRPPERGRRWRVPAGGADVDWTLLHSVSAVGVQFLTASPSGPQLRRRKQPFSQSNGWKGDLSACARSPGALLAQLARLLRITKPSRRAAAHGVEGVRARRHLFLI